MRAASWREPTGGRWFPLSKGKYVLVDESQFERVIAQGSWYFQVNVRTVDGGYAARYSSRRNLVYLHKFVFGAGHGTMVDHKNRNTLDCRLRNLRQAPSFQSSNANRRKHAGPNRKASSVYKGVYRPKDYNKWIAHITVNDKTLRLGTFLKEEDAARAYDRAARKYFGKFACVNFPRKAAA